VNRDCEGSRFIFGVGGFSKRQHYRMTITDEMQQTLCINLRKSAACHVSSQNL